MTEKKPSGRKPRATAKKAPAPAAAGPAPRAGRDPLGRRALFTAVPDVPEERDTGETSQPLGKLALFSTAAPADSTEPLAEPRESAQPVGDRIAVGERVADPAPLRGPVVVVCGRCHAASRIGFVELLLCQFPVSVWLPGRRFDHRMTCPACSRRVWASVSLVDGPLAGVGAMTAEVVRRVARTATSPMRAKKR